MWLTVFQTLGRGKSSHMSRKHILGWIIGLAMAAWIGGSGLVSACHYYPPPIWILAPAGGEAVRGDVQMEAKVRDGLEVKLVEFLVDGKVIASDAEAPYTATWGATKVEKGEHALQARGTLADGKTIVSKIVKVVVDNPAAVE